MNQGGMGDEDFTPLMSLDDDMVDSNETYGEIIPLVALKNTVMLPGVVLPITIGRQKSIKAIQKADKDDKFVVVVSQRDQSLEDPSPIDLYEVGVVAKIIKLLTMPDGSTTAILQGRKKVKISQFITTDPLFEVSIDILDENQVLDNEVFPALMSTIRDTSKRIIELSPNIPSEAVMMIQNIKKDAFLLSFITSNLNSPANVKQDILEINNLDVKAEKILKQLKEELNLLKLKNKIESKVKGDIEKQQRDYFLNQQMRTIQEELGGNPQEEEIKRLEEKAAKKKWPDSAKKQFEKELAKVRRVNPQVAEYSVILNYLELLTDLPWEEYSEDNFDLKSVKKTLDKDHHGLEDVKERILEHLAVLKLKGDLKAPILCLVGPPGVGKTSLGKSIASAINRKFIRMSLGGLHDESELRGHRKTYIGAMPGRVVQSLKKVGTSNPVFILDEIDKLGKNHRGDPSSALLEILDPEQNHSFHDNYLETEYDLSKVLFIATANSLNSIQPALLDRMEIIELSGYSTEEKLEIAKKHLVPKQRKEHGLKAEDIKLTPKVLKQVITDYTRESGVRSLNRTLAALMRNIARKKATEEDYTKSLSRENIVEILGTQKFNKEDYIKVGTPGVAVGLAWTRVGGDILFIESSSSPGKGKLTLTGNLGNVMKESATAALSYIKSIAKDLKIEEDYFEKNDIHIHVPEGAIPKDGPSAGITMITSLVSTIKNKKVKAYQAMTGEITLRGKVLPVGGIKEKVLAARRSGIRDIIMCSQNKKHVDEIPSQYIKDVNFHYVDNIKEVLNLTLSI